MNTNLSKNFYSVLIFRCVPGLQCDVNGALTQNSKKASCSQDLSDFSNLFELKFPDIRDFDPKFAGERVCCHKNDKIDNQQTGGENGLLTPLACATLGMQFE